jgi:hypothetical protein
MHALPGRKWQLECREVGHMLTRKEAKTLSGDFEIKPRDLGLGSGHRGCLRCPKEE